MKQYTHFLALQQDLLTQKITCEQIIQYYLKNIHLHNPELNVFLSIYENEALTKAIEIDKKIQKGEKIGKLAGLVVGIKDVLCYENHPLQAASKILEGFESKFNATAIERLLNEDAIIIGRQNCDEFAMGSSNENSAFGVTKNGIGKNKVPGGSSGASAVSVQMDMCAVALGTDTGGSVRQPASFCGIIGFKPTYSLISRYGLLAYASSFDCIGIFAHSIEDVALVLENIAGKDEFDSTITQKNIPQYSKNINIVKEKKKIAYFKETLEHEGLASVIKEKTLQKINLLKEQGHIVEEIDFPLLKYNLPTYYILTTAEASSNLSRYDGVKYGYRTPNAQNLKEMYIKTRSEAFGKEVQKRILLGSFVLSADYYDAYFTKAQKVRRIIKEETEKILENFDFIVMPTTPDVAFDLGSKKDNELKMYLEDLFTVQANVVGIPAISIPNGTDEQGLPIGFQIMTKHFAEQELLNFAASIL